MMTNYAPPPRSPGVLGRRDVEGLVGLRPQRAAPQSGGREMAEEVVRTEHRYVFRAAMHGGIRAAGAQGIAAGARTSHPNAGMRPNKIRAPQPFRADTRLLCLPDREGRARQLGR